MGFQRQTCSLAFVRCSEASRAQPLLRAAAIRWQLQNLLPLCSLWASRENRFATRETTRRNDSAAMRGSLNSKRLPERAKLRALSRLRILLEQFVTSSRSLSKREHTAYSIQHPVSCSGFRAESAMLAHSLLQAHDRLGAFTSTRGTCYRAQPRLT